MRGWLTLREGVGDLFVTGATRGALTLFGVAGRGSLRFLGDAGRSSLFLGTTLQRLPRRPFRPRLALAQIEMIGAGSSGVVMLSAIFTGLVLALQGYSVLVRFGSENLVGRWWL